MTVVNIIARVQNSEGLLSQNYFTSFEVAPPAHIFLGPVVDSVDIDPPTGPKGTVFTITINAHDQNDPPLELTFWQVLVDNIDGLAVQTAMPNVFTWQS